MYSIAAFRFIDRCIGQATAGLTPFDHVIGVDPSMKMVESARASLLTLGSVDRAKFRFEESSAENVPIFEDGTVDLIIAGTLHYSPLIALIAPKLPYYSSPSCSLVQVWQGLARGCSPLATRWQCRSMGQRVYRWTVQELMCLKQGYSEMRLTNFPSLTPLITDYFNGTDPRNSIGPYWEQPGRSILDGHLLKVPSATEILPDKFSEFERVFFTGMGPILDSWIEDPIELIPR
jgi:hypothetical protein